MAEVSLALLLGSWCRQLEGMQRKSPNTLRIYRTSVQHFLNFSSELTKANVIAWMESQADLEASTVRLKLTALKLFAKWLAEEEGFDADPILAVRPPKLDQRTVPDLSENEVRKLMKACDGTDLRDKRDKAIFVLLAETGLRAAELLALDIGDIDLDDCVVHVHRGKGGKGRRVHFSASAAAILDRYVRARHRAVARPSEGPLWITYRGRLTYTGMLDTLKGRARDAGVTGFHPHRLRHTAAVRWLRSGGTETGLMAHAGWASHSMVQRYVQAASEQLAGEEFKRLNLGIDPG